MSAATLISEMQKFRFGTSIFCTDGEYGFLAQVVFDPATRRMTHFAIRQGRLFGKITLLPFDTVINATSEGITLRIKISEVAVAANAGREVKGAVLSNKTIVELDSSANNKCSLLLVAVHPESGELAFLVAHHFIPGQDTLLRAELITTLASEHVTLTVPDSMPATFPPYQPDSVLQQQAESLIFDLTPMHVDMKGISVHVLDGVLSLDGNISSTLRGDIVVDQVLGIAGLLEIKNNLIGDDKLAADIASALARDPRVRDLPIGVYPRLGVVRLNGAVHTSQQKAAAEEIARSIPGVRSVINELSVDPKAELLHVMSPTGGDEDKVPNKYIRHTK